MTFILEKMRAKADSPVRYCLNDPDKTELNQFLGQDISITHTGAFACIQCNRAIKKTFQQGYCYPCLRRLQECNLCIIHPERCRVMEGCCPENDWAHQQCHANQVVYLSYTSGLKVGITQYKNIPSRWVDQGAVAAAAFVSTSNRFLCGQVEVALKNFVNDKTNWRQMLKESPEAPDLIAAWAELMKQAKPAIEELIKTYGEENIAFIEQPDVQLLEYPVLEYPTKITSLSLDKTPTVTGRLVGIKGQYLYFEHGLMNVRKFGGYAVDFST